MDGKLVLQLLDQLGQQLLLPHYHMLTPGGKDAESISSGTFFLHVTLPLALVHLGPQTALPESRETTFHEFSLLNRLQQCLLSSKVRIYPNCSGCVASTLLPFLALAFHVNRMIYAQTCKVFQ